VRWPVVVPSGADVLGWSGCCIGEQLLDLAGAGGAVWAAGVVGAGGAFAMARPGAAINTHESRSDWLIRMGRERPADAVGSPAKIPGVSRLAEADQRKIPHDAFDGRIHWRARA
jgi:hypothetical protein